MYPRAAARRTPVWRVGSLEQVYAIFANVIEVDEKGLVINAKHAERRAAQFILQSVTGQPAQPPFESWEICLYEPPPLHDPKPGT